MTMFINIVLFSGSILSEIRMVWGFFVEESCVSKSKTNDECYQKSGYRPLRINTLFLIC